MRLHSPQFERALRRGAKQAVRQSPNLKREFRRANRYRRNHSAKPLGRLFVTALVIGGIWGVASTPDHLRAGLAALALWTTWFAMIRAVAFGQLFGQSADLAVLFHLPLADGQILRWELQKYARASLWSLVDIAGALGALGLVGLLNGAQLLAAVPLGLFCWTLQHAGAAFCALRWPRVPPVVLALSGCLWMCSIFLKQWTHWEPIALLQRHADHLLLGLPTGWPLALLSVNDSPFGVWSFGLLLPGAVGIWMVVRMVRAVAVDFKLTEFIVPPASDLTPDDDFHVAAEMWKDAGGSAGERVLRIAPSEAEEIITTRRFLRLREYSAPHWVEMVWSRWLKPRERVLAEFVFPDGWKVTISWGKVFRNLLLAMLVALLVKLGSSDGARLIAYGGLAICGIHALSLAYGYGRAGQMLTGNGVNIPLHALRPVGYRETARLLFKCSGMQAPAVLVFCVVAFVLLRRVHGGELLPGVVLGVKATILVLAGRCPHLAAVFCFGTNDTTNVTWRMLLRLFPMLIGGLTMAGLAVAGLLVPTIGLSWGCLLALFSVAYGVFRFYGWLYHTNRFDLMAVTTSA
jgi:hypothetical protein